MELITCLSFSFYSLVTISVSRWVVDSSGFRVPEFWLRLILTFRDYSMLSNFAAIFYRFGISNWPLQQGRISVIKSIRFNVQLIMESVSTFCTLKHPKHSSSTRLSLVNLRHIKWLLISSKWLTYGCDSLLLNLLVEAFTVLEASRVAVSWPLRGIGRDPALIRTVVEGRCEVLQG